MADFGNGVIRFFRIFVLAVFCGERNANNKITEKQNNRKTEKQKT